MPSSGETRGQTTGADASFQAVADALFWEDEHNLIVALKAAIKQDGFTHTLKSLKKGRVPARGMRTVLGGVLEEHPTGLCDAALQTDKGPLLIRGARRADRESSDTQSINSDKGAPGDPPTDSGPVTPGELLARLADAGANAPASLICEVELMRFDAAQRQVLLPLLWHYILRHRDSNVPDKLAAVGAAIRKYIAVMPMDQMGQLADLLEPGHRSPLPVELEIEVAKMIFRNFEVDPPVHPDPQPELAQRLWEMVQAYMNPRILLRDKHSAIASLSIQAIVAMRSQLAEQAWQTAATCPYRWFGKIVSDNLNRLRERWSAKSPDAATWLAALQKNVAIDV